MLAPTGLVRVTLDPIQVQAVADPATLATMYGPGTEGLEWDDECHMVYSADGGDVTPGDHPNGDRIVPDDDGTLLITDPEERVVRQRIPSIRIPHDGSWLYAGFSHDYRWLIAGEPAGVQVFRHVPAVEPGAAPDGGGVRPS
ncbi:MAG: hypothetical protein ABGY75_10935 [Gemmataceae bacterium]